MVEPLDVAVEAGAFLLGELGFHLGDVLREGRTIELVDRGRHVGQHGQAFLVHAGEFDVCTLFYSRFKSVISQVPTAQQIIPLVIEAPKEKAGPAPVYDYEPAEDEILDTLLPRNLAVQIFRSLLENNASFYGAQMSAMDNATRNAGDMIRKQTLIYNRTRQAMITKELIEIISGAEAI